MKKAVKINSVIGVVEEVGELTFSVRVEDDNYQLAAAQAAQKMQ